MLSGAISALGIVLTTHAPMSIACAAMLIVALEMIGALFVYELAHERIICPPWLSDARPRRRLRQTVPLAEESNVMPLVPRDDVKERAHTHAMRVGGTTP